MEKIRQFSSCKLFAILYNSSYIELFVFFEQMTVYTVYRNVQNVENSFFTVPTCSFIVSQRISQVAERAAACGVPPLLDQVQKTRRLWRCNNICNSTATTISNSDTDSN